VRASHRRGHVPEWLREVWQQPTPLPRPGVDACRCAPPTNVGESRNGSVWCGGGQHRPTLCPSAGACQCVPPTITVESGNGSVRCGRADTLFPRPGVDTCRCTPPTNVGGSRNNSAWCATVDTFRSPSRRGRLLVCAFHRCRCASSRQPPLS
jgi:hypothetical protein